jgi:hypothetical protein
MDIAIVNLENNQGTTFRQQFVWTDGASTTPIDLTGCQAKMQVRPSANSETVYLELSTDNGGITLGGATGVIALFFNAITSAAFTFDFAVYDLRLTLANGDITKLIKGSFSVVAGVTK